MKNVFKWRIVTNKYLYITDENNGDPFILDKITGNRIYPNGIVTGTTVDDGKIGQIVSNIKVENTYKDLFDAMVRLAYTDSDASKLTFLDYKNYWNLDSDECVIEAVTPKCEGYEPVFNISAHTISDGEVEYTFYAERNEYDKTLRYNLDLGIPKGEKGDKGKDGKGCKGDQGDPGQNAIIQVIDATAHPIPSGSAPTATVVTATTQSDNTYTMSFDFGIPKGESGGTGGPGEKGDDGYSGVITDVVPHTNTVGHNDPANVTVSNIQIVKNDVNSRYETSFDLNFDIPKGETGAMGPEGLPAIFRQCDARVVETLDWYETAQVEAILTPLGFENKYDLTFEFKIPKGKPGEDSIVESGGTAGGGWIYNFNVPEFIAVTGLREPIGDFDVQYHQASGDADVTLRIYYPEDWGGTIPGGRGRSIKVNDSEILSSSSSTPLNLTDGTGVTISGDTGGTVTMSHADTSNQPSVINAGRTYIQSVELDNMGHVTSLTSATETVTNTWRPVSVGTSGAITSTDSLVLSGGTNVTLLTGRTGNATIVTINADVPDAMEFKGTLGVGGTISALPNDGTANIGDTYKVITDGTYESQTAKIGDLFICNDKTSHSNAWVYVPSGDDPSGSGTVTSVLAGTGLIASPNPITTTGTISHKDTSNQPSVINTGSNYIQSVELDGMGHVVGLTSSTISETYRPIEVNDVQILDKNETSKTLNLVNGAGISISGATDGTVTINSTVVNTDTKVTSAANHYGYASGSGKSSGLYKITTDDAGHVSDAIAVVKSDITALGIPGSDTDTTYKLTLNGTQKGSGTTDLGTFYAPTSGGTSGQYLKSNGNGAPIWATFPTIPSAPGTLTTTATTSQTTVTDESLSGVINLHKISKTGNYNDLLNKPTIPAAQVNADWNASSGVAEILNKPTLATVATSGSYNDLSNKPTIPVNTDYQVQQSSSTTNDEYCLLAKATTGATSVTGTTIFATGITINPYDNSMHVSGGAQIGDGLHVAGDTHMTDGLEVDGLTQLNFGLEVSGGSADLTDGLNITGNTYCTGAYYASGTYSSSDIRKKDVLGEISLDKAYELVNKCQTIFYTWKDDETKKKEIGLIAQEVQQYFQELVSEDKDGYLTLDYSKLSVILLTVIKDLTQKVNKIDKLEEKIKMLEEKLK